LYSSLSITTIDLPLSAGTILIVSSFLRFCRAFSCCFVMLTETCSLNAIRIDLLLLLTRHKIISPRRKPLGGKVEGNEAYYYYDKVKSEQG